MLKASASSLRRKDHLASASTSTTSVTAVDALDSDMPLLPAGQNAQAVAPLFTQPKAEYNKRIVDVLPEGSGCSRPALALRLVLFLFFEVLFLTLAACCARYQVILASFVDNHSNEFTAGVTVLSIIWQTLAIMMVKDVVSHVFASEWLHVLQKTDRLVPGRTDKVSILSSGYISQTQHFGSAPASWSFRLAFLASLVLLALASFGPGTISLATVSVEVDANVSIGRLTLSDGSDGLYLQVRQRAASIVNLEAVQNKNTLFGFSVQPNTVVGWPPRTTNTSGKQLVYPSDVVQYRHSCSWVKPTLQSAAPQMRNDTILYTSAWTWEGAPGGTYMLYWDDNVFGYNPFVRDLGIFPLWRPDDTTGTSSYAFFGGNASIIHQETTGENKTLYSGLDLTGLPTLYSPLGFNLAPSHSKVSIISAPGNGTVVIKHDEAGSVPSLLVTFLVCEPQQTTTKSWVRLHTNGSLSLDNSKRPLREGSVGNIPLSAASLIFSQGLLSATAASDSQELIDSAQLNPATVKLFLSSDPASLFSTDLTTGGVKPLPISQINTNLDDFVLSASKAYVEGYNGSFSPATTADVNGFHAESRSALVVTSLRLLASTAVLVGVATLLMVPVVYWEEDRKPFSLATVTPVVLMRSLSMGGDGAGGASKEA